MFTSLLAHRDRRINACLQLPVAYRSLPRLLESQAWPSPEWRSTHKYSVTLLRVFHSNLYSHDARIIHSEDALWTRRDLRPASLRRLRFEHAASSWFGASLRTFFTIKLLQRRRSTIELRAHDEYFRIQLQHSVTCLMRYNYDSEMEFRNRAHFSNF